MTTHPRYHPPAARPDDRGPLRRGAKDMRLDTALRGKDGKGGFLQAKRRAQRAERTLGAYEESIRLFIDHIRHEHGRDDTAHFTRASLESWLDVMQARGLKASTRALRLTAVREFARYCLRERILREDPLAGVDEITRPKTLPRPFSREERARLMALALPLTERALRALLNFAGLRDAEVCGLRVRDLTRPALLPDGSRLLATLHVTGKGARDRVIPLADEAWTVLEDYLLSLANLGPASFLFTVGGEGWRPWKPSAIWRRVRRWGNCATRPAPCARADCARCAHVDACTPHRFRHRYGTDVYEATGDVLMARDLLGHASTATTQIYAQVTDVRRHAAVAKVAALNAVVRRPDYVTPAVSENETPPNHAP